MPKLHQRIQMRISVYIVSIKVMRGWKLKTTFEVMKDHELQINPIRARIKTSLRSDNSFNYDWSTSCRNENGVETCFCSWFRPQKRGRISFCNFTSHLLEMWFAGIHQMQHSLNIMFNHQNYWKFEISLKTILQLYLSMFNCVLRDKKKLWKHQKFNLY